MVPIVVCTEWYSATVWQFRLVLLVYSWRCVDGECAVALAGVIRELHVVFNNVSSPQ